MSAAEAAGFNVPPRAEAVKTPSSTGKAAAAAAVIIAAERAINDDDDDDDDDDEDEDEDEIEADAENEAVTEAVVAGEEVNVRRCQPLSASSSRLRSSSFLFSRRATKASGGRNCSYSLFQRSQAVREKNKPSQSFGGIERNTGQMKVL